MNRFLKLSLISVGILVVVIVAAAIVVPLVVDPNDYKDTVVTLIKKQTGRDLRIEGDIELSVFPWLAVDLGQIELGNAPGFTAPYFARLDSAKIRVRILPLLSKRLEAGMVTLHGFSINLEKAKDGRTNWQDLAKPETGKAPESKIDTTVPAALAIGGLDIRDAAVSWNDLTAGQAVTVDNIAIQTSAVNLVDPMDVNIQFDINSENLGVQGNVSMDTRIAANLVSNTYRADELHVSADFKGKGLPGGSLTLKGTGALGFDAENGKLDLSSLKLEAGGISFPPHDANITAEATGKGDLATNRFDLSLVKITAAITGGEDRILAEINGKASVDINALKASVSDIILKVPEFKMKDISAELSGKAGVEIDLTAMTVAVKDLNIDGSISGKDIPGEKIPVSLNAGIIADLKKQTATVKPFQFKALDMKAGGTLSVENPGAEPQLKGKLNVAPFNLRALLSRIVKEMPQTADPKALGSTALSLSITATADKLQVDKLAVKLDGSNLQGTAQVKNFQSPEVGFNLFMDQLVIDRYLPPTEKGAQAAARVAAAPAAAASGVALPLETLRKLAVDGRVQVGSLTASGIKMRNFKAGIKAKDGLLQLMPAGADLYEGTWSAEATLDARKDRPMVTFEEKINKVRLDRLLKDMGINPGQIDVSGPSTLSVKGSVTGDSAGKIFQIEGIAAKGNLGGRLPVGLDVVAVLDLDKERLRSDKLALHLGDLNLKGQLALNGFSEDATISADISAPIFNLRKVLKQMGISPGCADPKALGAVSLKAAINGGANALKAENIDVRLDDTTLNGFFHFAGPSPSTYAFDIKIDHLDADRYLPPPAKGKKQPAATPGAALAALPVDLLRNLHMDGKLAVERLKIANLKLQNIQLVSSARDGLVTLHPVTMTLYDGSYSGNIVVDARKKLPHLSLDEKLTNIQAGPLMHDLAGRAYLSGLTQAGIKFTATGADTDALLRTLAGTISFNLADGSIYGVDIAGKICRTLGAFTTESETNQDLLSAALNTVVKQAQSKRSGKEGDQTEFSELSGSMVFKNGIGTNDYSR